MKSILIFASGTGSHFQNFVKAQHKFAFRIQALVCNNPQAQVIIKAQKAQIKTIVVNHRHFATKEQFEQKIIDQIKPIKTDLVLLAGFMRILSPYFFAHYQKPMLNIHPSVLPKYKGINPHKQVLASKDCYHGASVHLVNQNLDSGQVIKQIKIPIKPDDDEQSLAARLLPLEHKLYLSVLKAFCQDKLKIKTDKIYFNQQILDEALLKIYG